MHSTNVLDSFIVSQFPLLKLDTKPNSIQIWIIETLQAINSPRKVDVKATEFLQQCLVATSAGKTALLAHAFVYMPPSCLVMAR